MQDVAKAVARHLPGRTVLAVRDRGTWVRRIISVTLDGGEEVLIKVRAHTEWAEPTEKEAYVVGLLREHGLPAPEVLAVDTSGEPFGQPYLIQRTVPGRRLSDVGPADRPAAYAALGRFYRRLHAIAGERPAWIEGPGRLAPGTPNRFMHQAAVVEPCGQLVAAGHLAADIGDRVVAVAEGLLPYLEAQRPCLVHGGALPWTIALAQSEDRAWDVARLSDLPDALWWDAAFDLALLKEPPFGAPPEPSAWDAFLAEYGSEPPEQRMQFYRLMQLLVAATGGFLEPETHPWEPARLEAIPDILQRICRNS